jgi:hypothetical protein
MGWPTATEAEAVAAPAQELPIEERNQRIQIWLDAKATLESAKATEAESRLVVTQTLFPTPKKGTQRFQLANGYAVKLVCGYNFTLGDKDKTGDDGVKISIAAQVEAVQDAIEALGPEGSFIADRVIKWKPELSVTEYEKLGESAIGLKAKELIDAILTVTPATPQLSFEEPKAK